MQGLAQYGDDSSPEPPASINLIQKAVTGTDSPAPTTKPGSSSKLNIPSGVVLNKQSPTFSAATKARPIKRRRRSQSPNSLQPPESIALPENLTHTAQSDLPKSEIASSGYNGPSALDRPRHEGAGDDEILKILLMPESIDGVDDWGIPPEVDVGECDPQLTAKIENFLRLKFTQGEHINTRLLASSAFANPHIYSRLVEFVAIDEHATAFPASGWVTRQDIESLIPTYGPAVLSAEQKRKSEASKAAQLSSGNRKEIGFAKAKHVDSEERRGEDRQRERPRDGGRNGDWHRSRDKEKHKDRDRERISDWR